MPRSTKLRDRNAEIYARRQAGASIAELSTEFLLSGKRIQAICTREKKKTSKIIPRHGIATMSGLGMDYVRLKK